MTATTTCEQTERVAELALRVLPATEHAAFTAHLASCEHCRRELETLSPVVERFVDWPVDVLRPPAPLWDRIAQRVGDTDRTVATAYQEPAWKQVAPGISCKLLATDKARAMVSMLVRLAPNVDYPPHSHAGVEELHLLEGELWINDHKLVPGDYNRAEPGTSDTRVWSETGCTCVLITSSNDILG